MVAGALPAVGVAVNQPTPFTVETVAENGSVVMPVPDAPILRTCPAGVGPFTT
jgi:hypothetical protein